MISDLPDSEGKWGYSKESPGADSVAQISNMLKEKLQFPTTMVGNQLAHGWRKIAAVSLC